MENGGLAGLDQRGVEVLERLDREEDLAANLDQLGHRVVVARRQPVRDALDRADVGRDVLADPAVAAGGAADQAAALVGQVDRDAVDLELAQELEGRRVRPADVARDPGVPGREVFGGERVVEAHHPLAVLDRR